MKSDTIRRYVWAFSAPLLALPAIAMQFDTGVNWSARDFGAMAVMLGVACGCFEGIMRLSANTSFRLAGALAVLGAFLLVWANLAVGSIGAEENPINWAFVAIPATGITVAGFDRFRIAGMLRAMRVLIVLQLAAAVVAYFAEGTTTAVLTASFAVFWIAAALLFARAQLAG